MMREGSGYRWDLDLDLLIILHLLQFHILREVGVEREVSILRPT